MINRGGWYFSCPSRFLLSWWGQYKNFPLLFTIVFLVYSGSPFHRAQILIFFISQSFIFFSNDYSSYTIASFTTSCNLNLLLPNQHLYNKLYRNPPQLHSNLLLVSICSTSVIEYWSRIVATFKMSSRPDLDRCTINLTAQAQLSSSIPEAYLNTHPALPAADFQGQANISQAQPAMNPRTQVNVRQAHASVTEAHPAIVTQAHIRFPQVGSSALRTTPLAQPANSEAPPSDSHSQTSVVQHGFTNVQSAQRMGQTCKLLEKSLPWSCNY